MRSALAADVLADTGLATRAAAFDPVLAWEHQSAALSPLIPACARALRGDGDAAHRSPPFWWIAWLGS